MTPARNATNLSAGWLFTKLLFYGPARGAAACLSTDQEIISVKKTQRAALRPFCLEPSSTVRIRTSAVDHMVRSHGDAGTDLLLLEIRLFIVRGITFRLLALAGVSRYASAEHIASMRLQPTDL